MAKDHEPTTLILVCAARPLRIGLRSLFAVPGKKIKIIEAASLGELAGLPLDSVDLVVIYQGHDPILAGVDMSPLPEWLPVLWLVTDLSMEPNIPITQSRASGILPIDTGEEEIQAVIQALLLGFSVFPPRLLGQIKPMESKKTASLPVPGQPLEADPLSRREFEILQALSLGLTNKEIAQRFSLSENTIKFHLASIFSKLEVNNRTEAVRKGIRLGLITL